MHLGARIGSFTVKLQKIRYNKVCKLYNIFRESMLTVYSIPFQGLAPCIYLFKGIVV